MRGVEKPQIVVTSGQRVLALPPHDLVEVERVLRSEVHRRAGRAPAVLGELAEAIAAAREGGLR